ncbi:MAG: sulfurtransferase TusA family protein [Treponema sp.]|jgi:TusA-related sulfurtransferase|nr:sulfurtransferase TusA family protein [Treponema sp.]
MSVSNVVDACGLSCPEPVLLTERALREYGAASFSVDVSSAAARDNVKNLLEGKGRAVRVEATVGGWRITTGAG